MTDAELSVVCCAAERHLVRDNAPVQCELWVMATSTSGCKPTEQCKSCVHVTLWLPCTILGLYDTLYLHALYSLPIAGGIYRTATTKKQKKIVNITFLSRCGASLWWVTLSRHYLHRLCPADYGHIMTSFSKPELHNVLRRPLLKRRTLQGPGFIKIATYTYNTTRRQKTNTPRPPATRTENLAKPGCVISELYKWTHKQTGRQTDRHAHHNTPLLFGSRVMKKWKTDIFTEKKRSK